MGRIVIKSVEDSAIAPFPSIVGMTAKGNVETKPVIADAERPLFLWHHTLAPGSEITWDKPAVDHLVYAFEGTGEVDGDELKRDAALMIAHGGKAVLRATNGPLEVAHFHRPDSYQERLQRPGGCTHVVTKEQTRFYRIPETDGYVYYEAACPTCEPFFHNNTFNPSIKAARHYHTEDELILIIDGAMSVGKRQLKRGSALAIDANTVYGFGASDQGLAFINYRPCKSSAVVVDMDTTASSNQAASVS